jgi:hypothetical protein
MLCGETWIAPARADIFEMNALPRKCRKAQCRAKDLAAALAMAAVDL